MSKDCKIITDFFAKGGTGKTTMVTNLGYALASKRKKILLVDVDAQANLTNVFSAGTEDNTLYELLMDRNENYEDKEKQLPITDFIYETEYKNIDILPANQNLTFIESTIDFLGEKKDILNNIFKDIKELDRYDYVLADVNGAVSTLNLKIVEAGDFNLCSVQPGAFNVHSLCYVVALLGITEDSEIKYSKENIKDHIGVVFNMVDNRENTLKETKETLNEIQDDVITEELFFNQIIRADVKVQKSQWNAVPVTALRKTRASQDYMKLAKEVIQRV